MNNLNLKKIEKDLIGTVDFIIDHIHQQKDLSPTEIISAESIVEFCNREKKRITDYTDVRHQQESRAKEYEKSRWKEKHRITCRKCNCYFEGKAFKESKQNDGLTYYLLRCPKCQAIAASLLPVSLEEQSIWMDRFIEDINKKDEHGNYNSEKYIIDDERLKVLTDERDKLNKDILYNLEHKLEYEQFMKDYDESVVVNKDAYDLIKKKLIAGDAIHISVRHDEETDFQYLVVSEN